MEYLLVLSIGIIIGILVIITINTKKTREEEKHFFEEYKECQIIYLSFGEKNS